VAVRPVTPAEVRIAAVRLAVVSLGTPAEVRIAAVRLVKLAVRQVTPAVVRIAAVKLVKRAVRPVTPAGVPIAAVKLVRLAAPRATSLPQLVLLRVSLDKQGARRASASPPSRP
jgi:hypothetical protein